jgi:hypothetical protein
LAAARRSSAAVGAEIFVLAAVRFALFLELLALVPKLFRSELNAATTEAWALPVEVTAMTAIETELR